MKSLEYRFMIPLEASKDSGFMMQRAQSQARLLGEVVEELVASDNAETVIEAAKLMKRIDIFVEGTKFQANSSRNRNLFPVNEDKRLGFHDAQGEILTLITQERSQREVIEES